MPADRKPEGLAMAESDRTKIAADRAARGFSCDLWTGAPGQRREDFQHAEEEMVAVLAGEMEFEVGGQIHRPKARQELLIPAGTVHSASNVGRTTARWLSGYRRT
jgi:quercetin dioxygenase-like cupin family protein